jgi:hypothetical protein
VLPAVGDTNRDRGDYESKLTLIVDLINLSLKIRGVTHLHLAYRIKSVTRSSNRGESVLRRTQSNRYLTSEITFLYQRPKDREGGQDGGPLDRWRDWVDMCHVLIHEA